MESNEIYLSELKVKKNNEFGLYIRLHHYNDLDYIEDVLIEKFNFDSFYVILNEPYIIGLNNESQYSVFSKIIEKINRYHSSTKELFETV